MPLFMVRSHVKPEHRDEVLRRYAQHPSAGAGVENVGDWALVDGDGAYHLMRADDPKAILDEIMKYSDLCSYTIEPVVNAEEFLPLISKHGIG